MTLQTYLTAYDPLPSMNFVSGDYDFMVSETLEMMGIEAEAEATDKELHTVGKLMYWTRVRDVVSSDVDFNADGGTFNRSQIYEMAEKNIAKYSMESSTYLSGEMTIEEDYSTNPYRYTEARDEAGNF